MHCGSFSVLPSFFALSHTLLYSEDMTLVRLDKEGGLKGYWKIFSFNEMRSDGDRVQQDDAIMLYHVKSGKFAHQEVSLNYPEYIKRAQKLTRIS